MRPADRVLEPQGGNVRDAEFLAEIAASPADATPYLVYADALLQRGDPRGELIIVQHALETAGPSEAVELRRREAALFDQHHEAWLGPLDDHRDAAIVRWHRGFIAAARVWLRGPQDGDAALRALLAVPCIRSTLVELRLGPHAFEGTTQDLLDTLCDHWPAALRHLYVNDAALERLWTCPAIDLAPLAYAPRLETLVVQATDIRLGWSIGAPPQLVRLALRAPTFDATSLAAVQRWPWLARLALFCRDVLGPAKLPDAGLDWLTEQRFPSLDALALTGTSQTDGVAAALVRLPLVHRLDALDLSGGTLGVFGARALATAPALPPIVDVRRNLVPPEARAGLVARGAFVEPQREGVRSLIEREELLAVRAATLANSAPVVQEAVRQQSEQPLVDWFALEPRWGEDLCLRFAGELKPEQTRAICAAIARRWVDDLEPRMGTDGLDLHQRLSVTHAQLDELHAAEAVLWTAVQHGRWHRWIDRDDLIELAATLRTRYSDVANVVMRTRVAAGFERLRAKATPQISAQSLVALGRGRFAEAEAIARDHAAKKWLPQAALLADMTVAEIVWVRSDVDSLARAPWLLAVRELRLRADAANDDELAAVIAAIRGTADVELVERSRACFVVRSYRRGERAACALLAELALRDGLHRRAATLLAAVDAGSVLDLRERATVVHLRARLALARGDHEAASIGFGEALALHRALEHRNGEALDHIGLADAASSVRRYGDAGRHAGRAMAVLVRERDHAAIAAVRLRFGQYAQLSGERRTAWQHYQAALTEAARERYLRLDHRIPHPPQREPELVARVEIWQALAHAQDARLRDAYRLLGRARTRLPATCRADLEAIAMGRALVGRFAGCAHRLPDPRHHATRLMTGLLA